MGVSWSLDLRALAYVDRESDPGPLAIFLLDVDAGGRRRLTNAPAESWGDRNPVFSPGGTVLAFVRMDTTVVHRDVFTIDLNSGTETLPFRSRDQRFGRRDHESSSRGSTGGSSRSRTCIPV